MATPKIGFIGLGRMGGPMSLRLINAGSDLVVFDTNADALAPQKNAGAAVAASPKDVVDSADLAFVSLPTPDIVEKVVLGSVAQGSRAKTVVDLSTSGPGMAARVSRGLEPCGVAWIDAPVSGGVAGAKNGTLAVMASGPRASFRDRRAAAEEFRQGLLRRRESRPRSGRKARQQSARRGRAGHFLRSAGDGRQGGDRSEDHARHHQCRQRPQQRDAGQVSRNRSCRGTFDFGFATGLSYKDVRLCVDEAESMGVPMVVGAAVRQMLAVTNAKFGPTSDFTSITRVVEEWAGVEVRG